MTVKTSNFGEVRCSVCGAKMTTYQPQPDKEYTCHICFFKNKEDKKK